jgi:hypothetical protein
MRNKFYKDLLIKGIILVLALIPTISLILAFTFSPTIPLLVFFIFVGVLVLGLTIGNFIMAFVLNINNSYKDFLWSLTKILGGLVIFAFISYVTILATPAITYISETIFYGSFFATFFAITAFMNIGNVEDTKKVLFPTQFGLAIVGIIIGLLIGVPVLEALWRSGDPKLIMLAGFTISCVFAMFNKIVSVAVSSFATSAKNQSSLPSNQEVSPSLNNEIPSPQPIPTCTTTSAKIPIQTNEPQQLSFFQRLFGH